MEHRIVLTPKEAAKLSSKLTFIDTTYVKDQYTGEKRIRTDETGKHEEKEYETPVTGTIERFSSKCALGDITDIWFEVKWTKDKVQFEVEFESNVPEEYSTRPNASGWEILKQ